MAAISLNRKGQRGKEEGISSNDSIVIAAGEEITEAKEEEEETPASKREP